MRVRIDSSRRLWARALQRPENRRRNDIQGIRAVAIISVVAYHADLALPAGFVGVDVFFVLSGFLISSILHRELQETGRIDYKSFIARRARRLIPAQALLILCCIIGSALLLSPLTAQQKLAADASISATAFAANAFFALKSGYFVPAAEENPLLHMWSLSVEEQYYLVFPVFVFIAWRLCHGKPSMRKLALIALAASASLSLSVAASFNCLPDIWPLSALAGNGDLSARLAFYSPVTRAWEFLAGAAAAVLVAVRPPNQRTSRTLSYVGATGIAVSFVAATGMGPFPGVAALLPAVATSLMLVAGHFGSTNIPTRLLSSKPLVAIGNVSYGWYLWHWPVIVFVKVWCGDNHLLVPLAAVLSLAPAVASYKYVERPITTGDLFPSSRALTKLIGACVVTSLAAASLLHAATINDWLRADLKRVNDIVKPEHVNRQAGCAEGVPLGPELPSSCTWHVSPAKGTILLIGDSNAGHFTEPMIAVARSISMNLEVATASGCPFLMPPVVDTLGCERFVNRSLASISTRSTPYSAIVISNFSVGYLRRGLGSHRSDDSPATRIGEKRAHDVTRWITSLESTLSMLGNRSPVLIVGAVPQHSNFPACLAPSILFAAQRGCGLLTRSEAMDQREDVISAEREVASAMNASYLDTADTLCSNGRCGANTNGTIAYRDNGHLSVDGSLLFTGRFHSSLRAILRLPSPR
jgi:peptidoglycan/LPS O-acetylase OafA/YrhL